MAGRRQRTEHARRTQAQAAASGIKVVSEHCEVGGGTPLSQIAQVGDRNRSQCQGCGCHHHGGETRAAAAIRVAHRVAHDDHASEAGGRGEAQLVAGNRQRVAGHGQGVCGFDRRERQSTAGEVEVIGQHCDVGGRSVLCQGSRIRHRDRRQCRRRHGDQDRCSGGSASSVANGVAQRQHAGIACGRSQLHAAAIGRHGSGAGGRECRNQARRRDRQAAAGKIDVVGAHIQLAQAAVSGERDHIRNGHWWHAGQRRRDGDGHQAGADVAIDVTNGVAPGLHAHEAGRRWRVAQAAIGLYGKAAVAAEGQGGQRFCRGDGQATASEIDIIGEHRDVHRRGDGGDGHIREGHRRGRQRQHRDQHGGAGRCAIGIAQGVAEGFHANETGTRLVAQRAIDDTDAAGIAGRHAGSAAGSTHHQATAGTVDIVAEHVQGSDGAVGDQAEGVGQGSRGHLQRASRQHGKGLGGAAAAIRNGVGNDLLADEAERRRVAQGLAIGCDRQYRTGRGRQRLIQADGRDGERIAIGIAIVGQHIDGIVAAVDHDHADIALGGGSTVAGAA